MVQVRMGTPGLEFAVGSKAILVRRRGLEKDDRGVESREDADCIAEGAESQRDDGDGGGDLEMNTAAADVVESADVRTDCPLLPIETGLLFDMLTVVPDRARGAKDSTTTSSTKEHNNGIASKSQETPELIHQIKAALRDIGPPGEFALGGALTLKRVCEPAPYGKGSETLLDTKVRNALQADAKVVHLSPKWNQSVQRLVSSAVMTGLGFPNKIAEARLYKLVLYESGGFFLQHQDTEKDQGMFGTLVIQLPSLHTGDVHHELKPVTSGWRLCLAYNLVQKSQGPPPAPANHEPVIARLNSAMKTWFESQSPAKLLVPLDHKYTQANLSFTKLKAWDLSIFTVLKMLKQTSESHEQLLNLYLVRIDREDEGLPSTKEKPWKRSPRKVSRMEILDMGIDMDWDTDDTHEYTWDSDSGDEYDSGEDAVIDELHESYHTIHCIDELDAQVKEFSQYDIDLKMECMDETVNGFPDIFRDKKPDERKFQATWAITDRPSPSNTIIRFS
ncbi:hypothetical protein HDU76_000142 [Blyttiomyces sp. JEL0837]|nr:hypothetical protein HDU76_000142 [Blyttiomyces sp. JEL0837]